MWHYLAGSSRSAMYELSSIWGFFARWHKSPNLYVTLFCRNVSFLAGIIAFCWYGSCGRYDMVYTSGQKIFMFCSLLSAVRKVVKLLSECPWKCQFMMCALQLFFCYIAMLMVFKTRECSFWKLLKFANLVWGEKQGLGTGVMSVDHTFEGRRKQRFL